MSKPTKTPLSFDDAIAMTAELVAPGTRHAIVDAMLDGPGGAAGALSRLRQAMRSHAFPGPNGTVSVRRMVDALDARTRAEGLHVIHGWDFNTHRRPADIAPVLLLDFCVRSGVPDERARIAAATLLDDYCHAILALPVIRAWDSGDPGENLDSVTRLIREIRGPDGSGHAATDDAETLLMLAVSYFHPEESAYADLLDRMWALDPMHALRLARPCAAVMTSHLRWGLRFMYRNDLGAMRADNVVDYPWVLFALQALLREHARAAAAGDANARTLASAGILDALAADPTAFTGPAPSFFAAFNAAFSECRDLLRSNAQSIVGDLSGLQPSPRGYSPVGFACNFLSNASVASVVLTIESGEPAPPLNALLRRDAAEDSRSTTFARQLMAFAARDPARLGAGGAPLIVYDAFDGVHHFNAVVRALDSVNG